MGRKVKSNAKKELDILRYKLYGWSCRTLYGDRVGIPPALCWKCLHAVPEPEKNIGCSWSKFLERIPHSRMIQNRVLECPEFVRG